MDLQEIFEQAREAFSARVVVGEPVERDGVTVIPAVSVRGGGGGGGGRERGEGGGGFGLHARPVGAWVIRGEHVRWEPAVDVTAVALAGIAFAAIALLRLRRR
jgi:uncharacterized spore protein YtfJ